MDECEPETQDCPKFESSPEKYQKYENQTWSLGANARCTVNIDATGGIARVIFSSTVYLGINYDAMVDEVITFESGTHELEIYNAAESGPITFGISFSNAYFALLNSVVSAALVSAALLQF